jgi:hypothetical protein
MGGCLEDEAAACVYQDGPPETSYSYGYATLWSLAGLIHVLGGGHPAIIHHRWHDGILTVITVDNIESGSCPGHQVFVLDVA